jgi:hypothetical protein
MEKETLDKTTLVTFSLKVRAGSAATATTYGMKVAKFGSGTPAVWIEVLNSLNKLWTRNGMTTPTDREASVKTILRDNALTAFEASIEESQGGDEDDEDEVLTLTTEMVDVGLTDVSKTIFPPHSRALEIQKNKAKSKAKAKKQAESSDDSAHIAADLPQFWLLPGCGWLPGLESTRRLSQTIRQ